ncbi:SDR family oxidoreductase [Sphingobium phenoxybenzoativorans]|uniref:SDR family oxidoreductase n=1 Tax=Sphingobium phenoxybenzoativorans TaxID=1592790 RepID=A0A975K5D2_9SPHN|nr:SDR family oxidoreductase [Sphingobium phenoxybenzoativorans]QUT05108.1 SDR family oxidoreductase [Sphingobium phenoxybenzoativorans]
MTETTEMVHEDRLPGHESKLDPQPEWQPRYEGSNRLKDKVAIITGADSGIGRAVAALFAREGCDIVIVYLLEDDDAAETKRIVEAEGRRAITIRGDIGEKDFSDEIVRRTLQAFGRIEIVVNNAGEQHPDKDITGITEEQLRRTFQTNIFGMFFLIQSARPHLKSGAAIINCTSVTMYQGSKELLDYSSTKGAITAFTRSLSENLIGEGIRVNAVAPGPIWTPLNPCGGASPDKLEHFGESTPMGRPGQPNEVAPAFLFLACEDASYMSGQVLHPNGGTIING